jgi:hypothetical protein
MAEDGFPSAIAGLFQTNALNLLAGSSLRRKKKTIKTKIVIAKEIDYETAKTQFASHHSATHFLLLAGASRGVVRNRARTRHAANQRDDQTGGGEQG